MVAYANTIYKVKVSRQEMICLNVLERLHNVNPVQIHMK